MNVPKIRFPKYNYEWNYEPLNKYVERIVRKNKNKESDLVLTISAQYGLVDQCTFFNRNVSSSNLDGYYLLYKGDFAYNKSYSNGYPWGAVKRLNLYDKGVVSSLYICFNTNNLINSDYLQHYFETNKWYSQISSISVEGARNHGLLNIAVNDFFNTDHFFPKIDEQKDIAKFLNLLDKKIELQSKKIEDLKLFKMSTLDKYFNKDTCKEKALLKKYCSCLTGKSKADKVDINGKYYIMDMGTVNSDGNILKTKPTFCNLDLLSYGDLVMPKDDIGGGLIIGKTGFIDEDNKYVLGDHVYLLKVNDINSLFLHYQINSKYINKQLKRKVTGSAQLGLKSDNILNQEIYIYSEEEQKKIANIFKLIDRKIELETEKIFKLINLKKGLMQNMFV